MTIKFTFVSTTNKLKSRLCKNKRLKTHTSLKCLQQSFFNCRKASIVFSIFHQQKSFKNLQLNNLIINYRQFLYIQIYIWTKLTTFKKDNRNTVWPDRTMVKQAVERVGLCKLLKVLYKTKKKQKLK